MSHVIQGATALEIVLILIEALFHPHGLSLGGSHLAQVGIAYLASHLVLILVGFARDTGILPKS